MLNTPMHEVTGVIIAHLKDVFKENYDKGNFYLNPETEMYIRADFPENDEDIGFKPGIVLKTMGGLFDHTPLAMDQGFFMQEKLQHLNQEMYDDIYSGIITLQAIAQFDQEAVNLAYLTMISINKFRVYLVGNKGIADIHATQFSDSYPYKGGAYNDAFASDIQVNYSKLTSFTNYKQAVPLTRVNVIKGGFST